MSQHGGCALGALGCKKVNRVHSKRKFRTRCRPKGEKSHKEGCSFGWMAVGACMQVRRFTSGMTTVLLIAMLLLGSPLLGAPASAATQQVDNLPYELSLPLHDSSLGQLGVTSLGLPGPACDEQGLFAVRFCETLQENNTWNRVTIQVWDQGNPTPVRVGAKYTFMGSGGGVLQQGVFCEQTNTRVPTGATQLLVEVAHVESLANNQTTVPCGAVPFHGEVWLRWTSVDEPEFGTPPAEPADKCICECDCHPVFGCECECRPAEGSDCECNVEE